MIGPKKELYRAARAYLRHDRVDAIVATGEPFVLFNYATRLSSEFGVPWIADFRDPWSHDSLSAAAYSPAWDTRLAALHAERVRAGHRLRVLPGA